MHSWRVFQHPQGLDALSLPLTWMRAAIFLRMRGVGEENRKRSFREMLAESALATAMTMWRKLEEKVKNVRAQVYLKHKPVNMTEPS